jgi:GAF domain-containing protein
MARLGPERRLRRDAAALEQRLIAIAPPSPKLVADESEGQADQDRREGGEPRPLCYLPDGRGRHRSEAVPSNRDTVIGRATCDRRTIHVHDLAAEDSEYPVDSRDAKREGHRTTLATPLLREGTPIGVILIRRMEIRPFNDKQIALLETFADQAEIVMRDGFSRTSPSGSYLAARHAGGQRD